MTYEDLKSLNDIFIKALPAALEKKARQEIYYTIHFESEDTGECFDSYVFASEQEALGHEAYDNCGYGSVSLKKITREQALEMLIDEIDEYVSERVHEAGDVDPDRDYTITEAWFDEEVDDHIKYKLPGWQLLKEEYR